MNRWKNWGSKSVAIILSIAMVFEFLPTPTFAESVSEIEGESSEAESTQTQLDSECEEPGEIVGELVEKREENAKHFRLSNGEVVAVEYACPVHYEQDGQWKDMDHTLVPMHGAHDRLVTKTATVPVEFYRYAVDGLFTFGTKEKGIKLALKGSRKGAYAMNQSVGGAGAQQAGLYPETQLENLAGGLRYRNILQNTDLEYVVTPLGMKEYIVVKAVSPSYLYTFTLDVHGLIPIQIDPQTVGLYAADADGNADPSQLDSIVVADFMYDANGDSTEQVTLTLQQERNDRYSLAVAADADWINAPERAFPVYIDPTISTERNCSGYDCAYLSSAGKSTSAMKVGYNSKKSEHVSYLQFDLPGIASNEQVIAASLMLTEMSTGFTYTPSEKVEIHRVTSSWQKTALTWTAQPSHDGDVASTQMAKPQNNQPLFDITGLVQGWYDGSYANYGMYLKIHAATFQGTRIYTYWGPNAANGCPILTIRYLDTTGMEGQWSYHSAGDGGNGQLSVNDFTGHATYLYEDVALAGNILPVNIQHIHNQYEKNEQVYGAAMLVGSGWRLSGIETVRPVTDSRISAAYPYVYTDGDGTDHYFKKVVSGSTTKYLLETDDTVQLLVASSAPVYVIQDQSGNRWEFGKSNGTSYFLTVKKDANSNTQTYEWDASNRLTSVYSQGARRITLHYDSSGYLTKITDPAGRSVQYHYSNERLTGITQPDGTSTTFTYVTSGENAGAISRISVSNDIALGIAYHSQSPCRVQKIQEYGSSGTEGGYLSFTYHQGDTIVSDRDGNSEYLMFDTAGRVVSLRDGEEHVLQGSYTDSSGQKNLLRCASQLQTTVHSKITNGSMETRESWGAATGTCNGSWQRSTSQHYMGGYSVRVIATYTVGFMAVKQSVAVTAGKAYTFSCYLRIDDADMRAASNGGASLALRYTQNGIQQMIETQPIKSTGGVWQRYSVSAEIPAGATDVEVLIKLGDAVGSVYADCAQLEEGSVANSYNLLTNGTLEQASTNDSSLPQEWTRSSNSTSGSNLRAAATSGYDHSGYTMHMAGQILNSVSIQQTVSIVGSAGENFVVGGWGRGVAFPNAAADGAMFGTAMQFHYTDGTDSAWFYAPLNSNSNQWQYAACDGAAEKAFYAITVQALLRQNMNTVEFDNLQLMQTRFGQSYTYYSSGASRGKVKTATDVQGNVLEYTYYENDANAGQLKTVTYNGTDVTASYSYDAHQNVISMTDANESTTGITYDSFGNMLTQVTTGGGLKTGASSAYDSTGNFLLSSTDARGNTVRQTYDTVNGVICKGNVQTATDPNGNVTEYTYREENDILTQVKQGQSSCAYVYANARLTQISVGSEAENLAMDYGFAYNEFNEITSVTAGSHSLIQYTYGANHGQVSAIQYGNGQWIQPEYDSRHRIVALAFRNSQDDAYQTCYRWGYGTNGKIGYIQDLQNGAVTRYTYNGAGNFTEISVEKLTAEAAVEPYHIQFIYDGKGKLSEKRYLKDGSVRWIRYTYDKTKGDRLSGFTVSSGSSYVYAYDGLGRMTARTMDRAGIGSVAEQYSYLPGVNGNTTQLVERYVVARNGISSGNRYVYDANGNITAIYAVNGGQETLAHSYAYDGKNQLIREDAVGDGTYLYAYDGRGNLLSKSAYPFTPPETAVSGVPTVKTYTYSDLLADGSDGGWHDLLTGYDGQSIVYDGVGNPTEYLGWNMSWTQGRRLASMESADQTITYAYNQDGQRVEKSVCEKQSGVQTVYRYVLDGNRVVGMSVTAGAAPADFVWYDYDPSGSVIGFTVEKQDGTSSDFVYLKNLQGDVTEILNAAGQPVMTYTYNAWGLAAQTQAAGYDALSPTEKQLISSNPFRYRGYFYDAETGFYATGTRYYDPIVGRFISPDTTDVLTATPMALTDKNLYAYCDNNPVVRVDHGGEFWHIVIGAVVGGLIGGAVKAVSNVIEGKDITDGLGTAMLAGAASGALVSTGVGLVGMVAGNAAISMAENATNQVIANKGFNNFDVGDMVTDGVIGGFSGAIGGAGRGSKHLTNLGKQTVKRTVNTTANKGVKAGMKEAGKAFAYYGKNTGKYYRSFLKGLPGDFFSTVGTTIASSNYMKHQYRRLMGR